MHHPHSTSAPACRTRAAAVVTALAALALSACSVADQSAGSATAEEQTVTLLTHDSFTLPPELIEAFEEETGYSLQTTSPGDAGAVANQLLLAEGDPGVDAVYGVEAHTAHELVAAGEIAPFGADSPAAQMDGHVVPIDRGQVCVNADDAWFAAQARPVPTSFEQLASPEYAPLLVVTDPVTSAPGLTFLAALATAEGETGWEDWWGTALANGMKVSTSWSDAYYTDFSGADGAGEYPLVLSYSSSPAFAQQTSVVESTCTQVTEYAGIAEGAQNPEGARELIAFLRSPEVQEAIPEAMYMYPAEDSTALPEQWAEHAQLVADPIHPDAAQVAEHRAQWLQRATALREQAGR